MTVIDHTSAEFDDPDRTGLDQRLAELEAHAIFAADATTRPERAAAQARVVGVHAVDQRRDGHARERTEAARPKFRGHHATAALERGEDTVSVRVK